MAVQRTKQKMLPLVLTFERDWEAQGWTYSTQTSTVIHALAEAWDEQTGANGRKLNRSATSIDAIWIEDWFRERFKHLAPNSRRKYAMGVAKFIDWGADRDYFDRQAKLFRRGRISSKRSKAPVWLEMEDVRDVWEQCGPYWRGLISITYLTGARGSEICEMTVGDIKWNIGKYGAIQVRRLKTDEDDYLKLTEDAAEELRTHLAECERLAGRKLRRTDYVFGYTKRRWGKGRTEVLTVFPAERRASVGTIIKDKLIKYLPFDYIAVERQLGMGGHTLRRSAMRNLYFLLKDAGVADPLGAVQGQGGWSERATVEIYIGITAPRQARDDAFDLIGRITGPKRRGLSLVRDAEAG